MRLSCLTLVLASLWTTALYAGPLQVVVSIKPLHSLVSAIMGEVGDPTLLIDASASPHTFSLKPSHAIALSRADLVVWIGPELERFLEAPLANLATDARSLALIGLEGITRLPVRKGGIWNKPHNHEGAGNTHDRAHDRKSADPHIWLAVPNAITMVSTIETTLGEIYPDHAVTFTANAEALKARLITLDTEIAARIEPLAARPFFVFHDAYQYFENRYGLSPLGAVTINPDIRPGVRRLVEMKEAGDRHDQLCVFAEPQFAARLAHLLTENNNARVAYLDPLGSTIAPGPEHYIQTMRVLSQNLANCLTHP